MPTFASWTTTAVFGTLAALPAAAATHGAPSPFALEASLEGQNPPGGVPPDRFGSALSMDLGNVAIGVPGRFGAGGDEVGSVLLFTRNGDGWSQIAIVRPDDGDETDRFGSAVSLLGAWLAVGTDTQFGATRGVYVFRQGIGGFVQDAHLMPPVGEPTPTFGRAVAIVGDGGPGFAWLAVGAPATNAVYVYRRAAGTWTFHQKLVAADADPGAGFGSSVSMGSSFDVIVVGAPAQDTTAATDSGAAYVFRLTGGSWAQEAKLQEPDAAAGDRFGAAVAHWKGTVVVGAPGDDLLGAVDRGSAHAFLDSAGTWSWQGALTPVVGSAGHAAGSAVTVNGDAALVGAPAASGQTGLVHPFRRENGTWVAGTPFVAGASDGDDRFGAAVALFENRAVVGAPARMEAGVGPAGAAYAFTGTAGAWNEVQTIVPDHGAERMRFGQDVAVEDETIAVGAPGVNLPPGRAGGGVFTFTRGLTGWTITQRLQAHDPAEDDQLGESVALSGDTLIAGAGFKDLGGAGQQGAAYLFRRTAGVWTEEARLVAPDTAGPAFFGADVAIAGDTAVVGAFLKEGAFPGQGAAYVFVRSGATWTFQQKLTASDPSFNAGFGVSVSIVGDTIAVGAHGDHDARGAVYVFRRTGTTWSEVVKLHAPDGTANSFFGYATSLAGSTLAVGAPTTNAVDFNSGAVYIFVEGVGGWAFQQKLVPAGAAANTSVGLSVALSGERLVSGSGGARADVFERTGTSWTERLPLPPPPGGSDGLGLRVALSGPIAIAGAWIDDTPTGDVAGRAYVYRASRADLTVAIDDAQTSAIPGTTVTYDVVVRNTGPDAVVGARVTAPATPFVLTSVTWTCAADPGASCTGSGSGGLDDLTSMNAGTGITYVLRGTIPPDQTGTLTTAARVAAPAGVADPNAGNDLAQDVDALTRQTDLSVTMHSVPTAVASGQLVSWTTVVTNLGPSDSGGGALVHELAPSATLVSADPPPPACVTSAGSVTCALGTLASGGSTSLTVVQRVDSAFLGTITALSTASAVETDPVAANDQAQLQVEVIPPGDGELAHGSTLLASVVPGGTRYRISQRPAASYEAVIDATSGDVGRVDGPALALATSTSTVLTATPVGAGPSRSLRWRNDTSLVVDDQYVSVTSQGCTTSCTVDDAYRIRVYETTLRAPRFNNAGAQGSVLILHNRSDRPVAARASFWSHAGVLLANRDVDLAAGGSTVVPLASVPGLAAQSGAITIAHDAPFGMLAGKMVALEPSTGFSFDTPLSSRQR